MNECAYDDDVVFSSFGKQLMEIFFTNWKHVQKSTLKF